MDHSTLGSDGDGLEPDIRRFIKEVNAAFARYPQFKALPVPQRRQIAEEVRARWAAGGPRMAMRIDTTIPSNLGPLKIRVHNPSASPRKPALIYLHGGGWTMFSIDTHDRVMREYAARADMVVIGVDYALSPETRYPGPLQQVIGAVRWIGEHHVDFDIDPQRIALGGDSAGGNLTIAACLALRDAGESDLVRAMVLNYAALDSRWSAEADRCYGGEDYMLGSDEMRVFWQNYAGSDFSADDPLLHPIHASLKGLPPALLVIAECDILAEQNVAMATKLQAAGVPTQAKVYRGASHSFLEAVSIAAISDLAFEDTSRWLRAVFSAEPGKLPQRHPVLRTSE